MPPADYDRFTTHDGLPIAYRVKGEGKPVVLIHGYTVVNGQLCNALQGEQ